MNPSWMAVEGHPGNVPSACDILLSIRGGAPILLLSGHPTPSQKTVQSWAQALREFAGSQFSLPLSITRWAARNQTPALQMCQFNSSVLGTRDRAQGAGKSSPRSSPRTTARRDTAPEISLSRPTVSIHSTHSPWGVSTELHISLWEQLCGPWDWKGTKETGVTSWETDRNCSEPATRERLVSG